MRRWYQRDPACWLRELEAVAASGLRLRHEKHEGGLAGWRGEVDVDGSACCVEVIYPEDYPARPPVLRETRDLTDDAVDHAESFHQSPSGELCLFALGGGVDAWTPELTVVDAIERCREFRGLAMAGAHVDEHGIPLPREPGARGPLVLVLAPGQCQVFRMPGAWGWVRACRIGGRLAMVAEELRLSDDSLPVPQDVRPFGRQDWSAPVQFPWVQLPRREWNERLGGVDALERFLAERLPNEVIEKFAQWVMIVDSEETSPRPLLLERWEEPGTGRTMLLRHEVTVADIKDATFARVDGAMSGREALARWRIVIVGLGSLGGSVALHLARTGVSRFELFDPDTVRPENVCRHVVGLGGLYLPKVDAVRSVILDRNPAAKAIPHRWSPLWDGTPESQQAFRDALRDPATLIVVTTADETAERAINAMALQHGRPVVYASVLGAGEQGRVQRVLPGETPCYECIAHQQRRHPGRFFRASDPAPVGAGLAVAGYRQPGIPGVGLDVEQVAVHAARMVLQTLARLGNGKPDYPDAPGHHMVWSNRDSEGFDMALQARWERYEKDPACRLCGDDRAVATDETRDRIRELEKTMSAPERLTTVRVPIVESPRDSSPD